MTEDRIESVETTERLTHRKLNVTDPTYRTHQTTRIAEVTFPAGPRLLIDRVGDGSVRVYLDEPARPTFSVLLGPEPTADLLRVLKVNEA